METTTYQRISKDQWTPVVPLATMWAMESEEHGARGRSRTWRLPMGLLGEGKGTSHLLWDYLFPRENVGGTDHWWGQGRSATLFKMIVSNREVQRK